MVDQLVFGFERKTVPRTLLPHADVFVRVIDADVVLGEMLHYVHHNEELFATRFVFRGRVTPGTTYHLVQRLPEVTVGLKPHVHVGARVIIEGAGVRPRRLLIHVFRRLHGVTREMRVG